MKNLKHIIVSLTCLFISFSIQAQVNVMHVEGKGVTYPDGSLKNFESNRDINRPLWIVFSDRANNNTYKTAEAKSVHKTLDFLDYFFVVDRKNNFIRVSKGVLKEGDRLESAVDYGWIEMENMLLWNKCLYDKNKISEKVMLVNNADLDIDQTSFSEAEKVKVTFYADPELRKSTENSSQMFNLLHIYKISNGRYLLGKDNSVSVQFDDGSVKSNIYGWVPENKVSRWNTRVTLELNWDEEAYNERKEAGYKALIVDNIQSAEVYKTNNHQLNTEHIYQQIKENEGVRRDPNLWRLPILEDYKNGILKVNSIGKITDSSGKEISEKLTGSVKRKYEKAKMNGRNINIIFVLEDSPNNEPLYTAIGEALNDIEGKIDNNLVRFASVLYGSKSDRNAVLATRQTLMKYMKDYFLEIEPQNEEINEPAIIDALKAAIKKTNISKRHTNVVYLIGSKGMNVEEIESQEFEEVKKSLVEANCKLIAIQLENKDDIAYEDFIFQSQDIIQHLTKLEYNRASEIQKSSKIGGGYEMRIPTLSEVVTGSDITKYELKNSISIGSISYPQQNQLYKSNQLRKDIAEDILSLNQQVQDKFSNLDKLIFGIGKSSSNVDTFLPAMLDFIYYKAELSDEEFNTLSFDNFQASKLGYSVKQLDDTNYSLFNNVLFLSIEELAELLDKLKKLELSIASGSIPEQRQAMCDAWIQLIKESEGSQSNIDMTFDEMAQKVFGIPMQSKLLKKYTCEDLTQEGEISDSEFQIFSASLINKIRELEKRLNSDTNNIEASNFMSNGIRYFWVEESLLP